MTRDRSPWRPDDEQVTVDQYGRRLPAASGPDYLGGGDGHPRRARHAGPSDPYGQQDRYGRPDPLGPPGPYGPPDPLAGRDGRARMDRQAGRDDGYGSPDPYPPPDPYGQHDRYGQPEPSGWPDRYGQTDPFGGQTDPFGGQTDPFGGQNGTGRPDRHAVPDSPYGPPDAPYGPPDSPYGPPHPPFGQPDTFGPPGVPGPPAGGPGDYRQQDWRAGQDPLGGAGGYGRDARVPQARHRPPDEDDPTDPRGRHGGRAVPGQSGSSGQPDPYGQAPPRPGQGETSSGWPGQGEAPPSGPYRWRPPADLGVQEYPPPAVPRDSGHERRTGDWHYSGQEPGVAGQRERGQMPGEQGAWPEPVSYDAGWQEPAGNGVGWQAPVSTEAGWHEPAGGESGWHDPVTDQPGWQEPARPGPGWPQPVSEQAGWQEPAGDEQGWPDEAEPDSGILPGFRGGADDRRRGGRRPRRLRIRWIAPLVAFVVILAALGGAGDYLFKRYEASHANYTGPGTGSVTVQVLSGDSAFSLAPRLVRLGVIKAAGPFTAAAKNSTSAIGLQPGYFRLRKHMNAALAYAALVDPKSRIQAVVTIPEGLRNSQIVVALSAKTGIPASQFTKALKNPAALGLPAYANGNPEGYLFPATYGVQPQATATGILQQMVQSFNQEAAAIGLTAAAAHAKISESHAIIVASLVQAEGGRLQDFAKIARVIYNRLATGMQLQLDSTVMFAMHKYGIRATSAQLQFNSPYNTYLHAGLPPGPIDSPGAAAIKAALHPATGDWRYFVTVDPKTGLTRFTNSPAQFQLFVAELDKNLQNGT